MSVSLSNIATASVNTSKARNWDHLSDARRKPPKSACVYRVGPAPREEVLKDGEGNADIGTLDEDMDNQNLLESGLNKVAAASKALIIYFSKMAKKGSKDTVDFRFLESLILGGANVNVADKHGQTVMHEVARNWNVDVAKFFIDFGANVNQTDKWGRSPLHLASAVDHFEMVKYLINNSADIHKKTHGEQQTAIHYAAKYNAVGSLKILIENRANLCDKDYKNRTPLYIAAETAQEDSTRYLVDLGAPVGVFDDTGMSAICVIVEKMPHVALDALNQFVINDSAYRKNHFYLNYLESNPTTWLLANEQVDQYGIPIVSGDKNGKKKRKNCPINALKMAVELKEFDVIMHPVMQEMIKQKWNQFGKFGALLTAFIHITYIMIWTWLGIFLPRGKEGYYKNGVYWKIPIELIAVLMTFFFIIKQIMESKTSLKTNEQFRRWKIQQLTRDLEFCHPRWPQEKVFIESEMKAVRSKKKNFLSDPWNVFDLLTYISVLIVILTRILYVVKNNELTAKIHLRAYAFALIAMWLHFMKSCRPFTTLGPFITMLGHVLADTVTFAFLFFEFFIPYSIGFWILFGGYVNAKKMNDANANSIDWELFNNMIFSVWQVTLNTGDFFEGLVAVDRLMAQIFVGTFFMLSTVLCLNLYIALLSETFNRVYQNAKANASLLQANTVLQIEAFLSKKRAKKANDYIHEECAPLVISEPEDKAGITESEYWQKVVRSVCLRLDFLNDFLKEYFNINNKISIVSRSQADLDKDYLKELEYYKLFEALKQRDKELFEIKCIVYELKCSVFSIIGEPLPDPPKYIPLPNVNIRPPVRKILPIPSAQSKLDSRIKNNAVYRSIMDKKCSNGLEELDYDEEALSRSWENVIVNEKSSD
ncbi:transient receptor potential cation channel subfamily A member 1 [Hydra vulgaris]|uniref:Transient receptor potential cation channel subfamily A member 1 n=1 Tax=Hydra vulgaris TaxID=6087 RepID=A0ABM4CQG9_HYDVU